MLHGTAGSLENFAANIAAHAEHFNCIAFDMIGSGMTGKPDYDYETEHYVKHAVDFFNAMGIKKASVIGLSLGARVASRFAIDHPENGGKAYSAFGDRLFSGTADPGATLRVAGRRQRRIRHGTTSARSSKACFTTRSEGLGRSHCDAAFALQPARHEARRCRTFWRCSIPRSTTETGFPMRIGERCARPTLDRRGRRSRRRIPRYRAGDRQTDSKCHRLRDEAL